jgi:hypothetical protein
MAPAAGRRGRRVCSVAGTAAGTIAPQIERAYAEQLRGGLASWFAGARRRLRPTFRAGGGPVPAGLEVSMDPQAERRCSTASRCASPARAPRQPHPRGVRRVPGCSRCTGSRRRGDSLRDPAHGDAASYIFAGSHVGMMRELFADRRRAFYGQAAPVALPPLPSDAVAATSRPASSKPVATSASHSTRCSNSARPPATHDAAREMPGCIGRCVGMAVPATRTGRRHVCCSVPAAYFAGGVGPEVEVFGSGLEAHQVGGPVRCAAVHELALVLPAFVTEEERGAARL